MIGITYKSYNKANQPQSLRSLDSLAVARFVHGFAIVAQNNQQQVCRCLRRYMQKTTFLALAWSTAMIFGMFGGNDKKPEYVPDDVLLETTQVIVSMLDMQISGAKDIAGSAPDGDERFNALLESSFFYGYVMDFSNKLAAIKFIDLIDKENRGKNIQRLVQGVVANLFYPGVEPDWDAVTLWDAQATAYAMAGNPDYQRGMQTGITLGEEVLSGENSSSITLLGAELLKP